MILRRNNPCTEKKKRRIGEIVRWQRNKPRTKTKQKKEPAKQFGGIRRLKATLPQGVILEKRIRRSLLLPTKFPRGVLPGAWPFSSSAHGLFAMVSHLRKLKRLKREKEATKKRKPKA